MNSFKTWEWVVLQHVFISSDYAKLNCFPAHMFYTWSFSHDTEVPIAINQNKYSVSLNTYTTVFYWGYGNSNKNKT